MKRIYEDAFKNIDMTMYVPKMLRTFLSNKNPKTQNKLVRIRPYKIRFSMDRECQVCGEQDDRIFFGKTLVTIFTD